MQLKTLNRNSYATAGKIWFALLVSFLFDSVFHVRAQADLTSVNYILALAVILNSSALLQKITMKIQNLQASGIQNSLKHELLFIAVIVIAVFFEILSHVGLLVFQNLLLLSALLVFTAVSLAKSIAEKRRHEIRMRNDKKYFERTCRIQNLVIILLPSVLARAAALFCAPYIFHGEISSLAALQYTFAVCLFLGSCPSAE